MVERARYRGHKSCVKSRERCKIQIRPINILLFSVAVYTELCVVVSIMSLGQARYSGAVVES